MKIVLATGIYPPDIGGPATYVKALAEELRKKGMEVGVVTYGASSKQQAADSNWEVMYVKKSGGPLLRWWRYAKMLKKVAGDADIVIAFSSVSAGVPLMFARLKKPKKILRLGGDFFWERFTDRGGMLGLREWYARRTVISLLLRYCATRLLRLFNHIVYSTEFQRDLHRTVYRDLPSHSVIRNAMPIGMQVEHKAHQPFRVLFMGRFVGFKNLYALIEAISTISGVALTLVGDGPLLSSLKSHALLLRAPVTFRPPVHGEEKKKVFAEHDLLILPSLTEISPNVALEAHALCLPVLLSEETGLSPTEFIYVRPLKTPAEIQNAILERIQNYESPRYEVAVRDYNRVALEWLSLLQSL